MRVGEISEIGEIGEVDEAPDAIAIMGKAETAAPATRQLAARTGFAAALWHAARGPKPTILYVATDVHAAEGQPDFRVVHQALTQRYRVAEESLLMRPWSNCTLIEVRGVRVLCRAHELRRVVAVTHPYHARRTARYFAEVLSGVRVTPVEPDAASELAAASGAPELFRELPKLVQASTPGALDLARERASEVALSLLHRFDRRGWLERRLANRIRTKRDAYRAGGA